MCWLAAGAAIRARTGGRVAGIQAVGGGVDGVYLTGVLGVKTTVRGAFRTETRGPNSCMRILRLREVEALVPCHRAS